MGYGIKAVLISHKGKQYLITVKLQFECTNNITNYKAYTKGVLYALEMKPKSLKVYVDSALFIYQLLPYHHYIK